MMDRNDLDILTRISHSLENINRYLTVVDRAENLRRGDHPDTHSPITREMSLARTLLDTLMRQGTGTTTSGDLLSHIVDTDGDPARVREGMTDREANGLLWDSLVRTGTPQDQAQIIADLYVPIQDGTTLHAERDARLSTSVVLGSHGPSWEDRAASATAANGVPTPKDLAERHQGEQ